MVAHRRRSGYQKSRECSDARRMSATAWVRMVADYDVGAVLRGDKTKVAERGDEPTLINAA
jgi:hypothetical protein